MLRFAAWMFTAGICGLALGAAAAGYFLWTLSRDLPDHSALVDYEPPVMTRVHAADGSLIGEHARQRRIHLPIEAVPERVIQAFLAAEDRNFYSHRGLDVLAIGRAALDNLENFRDGRRLVGASTITQQVAKNMLLSGEVTIERKLREAILALRIERALDKDQILEVYLNEIYFGLGAYGIAAAAQTYFDKAVHELELAELAFLAALPKAPGNYHPLRQREQAVARRNWVLDRMWANGFISREAADEARAAEMTVSLSRPSHPAPDAGYFAEEVRRQLMDTYGGRAVYEGGMSVRTTLVPVLQSLARRTLADALVRYDREQGWRGPLDRIDVSEDWSGALMAVQPLRDVDPWRLAAVLEVNDGGAVIALRPSRTSPGGDGAEAERGEIPLAGLTWARWAEGPERGRAIRSARQVLEPGDVVYVAPADGDAGTYELQQVPEVGGALVALEPRRGRVLALVGGFSFDDSEFNRATQAMRQPGSAIKPFIYAAALDNGWSPASIIDDAPIEIVTDDGIWRPRNYSRQFYGPSTLRRGIESSRNVMTVRLAQNLGMPLIAEYLRRFGIGEPRGPYLSIALGAGETTPLRLTAAYAMIANGGRKIEPTLIDRIQDRHGRTIHRRDGRDCRECNPERWNGQVEPGLADDRERMLDPYTAYQMISMLEGVIARGTATVVRDVGRTLAGKTGTTNDFRDAWFVGFSPDLVVGVYIGYDQPRSLGEGMAGGRLAAPVFRDFMKEALADRLDRAFRMPAEMQLVEIDAATGGRAGQGGQVIVEAFRPGQEPLEPVAVWTYPESAGEPARANAYGHRAGQRSRANSFGYSTGPNFLERVFGRERVVRPAPPRGRAPSAQLTAPDPSGGGHR